MKKLSFIFALITVFISLFVICFFYFRQETYSTDFQNNKSEFGQFETVTGIPYRIFEGKISTSEELSHLRIPYKSLAFGKKLSLSFDFQLDGASVVEVGIRKGSFWLDYERIPVRNRILDELAFTKHKPWKVLSNDKESVFLSPFYGHDYQTIEDFISRPPQEGTIGLYGNTKLSCTECRTEPFQNWDDPKKFRAIYARYLPQQGNGFTNKQIDFALDNAYQNPDGSLEVMFFSYPEKNSSPTVNYRSIKGTISPSLPDPAGIIRKLKISIKEQLYRGMQ